jgi:hypothetical protein
MSRRQGLEIEWGDQMVDAFDGAPPVVNNNNNDGPWFDIPLDDDPPVTPPQVTPPRVNYPAAKNFSKGVNLLDARKRLEDMRAPSTGLKKALTFNPSKVKLTQQDEAAIDDWVRGGWSALNSYARGLMANKTPEELKLEEQVSGTKNQQFIGGFTDRLANVTEALKKLPSHAGKSYRQVNPKYGIESYARKIRPGDYVTDMGFSASSVFRGAEGAGDKWGDPGGLYFDIVGNSGKNITPYSKIGGEAEVLFLPGSTFHVDAVEVEANQTVWVLLTEAEVPDNTVVKNAFTGDPF